ncbi:MAG TPA: VOC family protein [Nocardioidaceae bacterium]|nr:VOC family protein [Nocardioidaceae bacterium]
MRMSVVLDCHDPQALVPFWCAALGYQHVTSVPGFEVLVPADDQPPGPVFILQAVREEKTAKNRMHVDVHPPLELGVPALTARLEQLGGTLLGGPVTDLLEEIGVWWQVMRDPEGNELDLVADEGHPPPEKPQDRQP